MASGPQHRHRNQFGQVIEPGTPEYEAFEMTESLIKTQHNPVNINSIDSSGDPVTDSSGNPAGNMVIREAFAGERNVGTSNHYDVGVDECNYHAWVTATGDEIVASTPQLVFGVLVTVTTAAGAIEIRDGIDATGTLVLTIPAAAAAGTFYELKGAKFNSGVFIDDASTSGSLTLLLRRQ